MSDDLTQRAERLEDRMRDLGWDSHGSIIRDLLARLQQAEQARDAACNKWETFVRELHLARAKQETAEAEVAQLRAAATALVSRWRDAAVFDYEELHDYLSSQTRDHCADELAAMFDTTAGTGGTTR